MRGDHSDNRGRRVPNRNRNFRGRQEDDNGPRRGDNSHPNKPFRRHIGKRDKDDKPKGGRGGDKGLNRGRDKKKDDRDLDR
jgi:hypothetical protein